MRKVLGLAPLTALLVGLLPFGEGALAGETYYLDRGESGFNLPGVTLPQGQDEVHAADGTTCRSAVSGSGSYLDVGAINSAMNADGNIATYARVVVPLGRQSSRLDCAKLYQLEVERLTMELQLLRMGMSPDAARPGARRNAGDDPSWTKEGWTDSGMTAGRKP